MTVQLILSLFPGLELLDRAFRESGFCVVAGPDRLLGADIRDFHPPSARFDGIIGGSPCQAFSALANLVRAKGLEPKFGNLVPEFERCVVEAQPFWFLHENVPRAPVPRPRGYAVHDFEICNSAIAGPDGLGQEQERVRRFAFGVRGCSCPFGLPVTSRLGSPESEICATCGKRLVAPNLRRWIQLAAIRLPAALRTGTVSRDDTRGQRDRAKGWGNPSRTRTRTQAVVADSRAMPVAVGGSGKIKTGAPRFRQGSVVVEPVNNSSEAKGRVRQPTIAGANPTDRRPRGGHGERRTLGEMLRLQGLPEDLLDDAPFTAKAKRRLVANGVPLPMGRAVAKAVLLALEELKATQAYADSLGGP